MSPEKKNEYKMKADRKRGALAAKAPAPYHHAQPSPPVQQAARDSVPQPSDQQAEPSQPRQAIPNGMANALAFEDPDEVMQTDSDDSFEDCPIHTMALKLSVEEFTSKKFYFLAFNLMVQTKTTPIKYYPNEIGIVE